MKRAMTPHKATRGHISLRVDVFELPLLGFGFSGVDGGDDPGEGQVSGQALGRSRDNLMFRSLLRARVLHMEIRKDVACRQRPRHMLARDDKQDATRHRTPLRRGPFVSIGLMGFGAGSGTLRNCPHCRYF